MHDVFAFFATGAALGLFGGLSPGPLQALICVQSITHGPSEGARVGLAPLFTDFPVMLLCLAVLGALSGQNWLMGAISLAGGAFVMRMGYASMRTGPLQQACSNSPARSWRKGVATNALNPNMWIFWSTVGAPTLLTAYASSPLAVASFLIAFYVCLIGTFMVLAFVFARCSRWLSGTGYVWTMRALGLLLGFLAARLIWDGLSRLGLA